MGYLYPGKEYIMTVSLSDRNFGTHYNPWLIFDNKEDYEDKRKNLKVTYEDEFDDREDDWDYDYYDYEDED